MQSAEQVAHMARPGFIQSMDGVFSFFLGTAYIFLNVPVLTPNSNYFKASRIRLSFLLFAASPLVTIEVRLLNVSTE